MTATWTPTPGDHVVQFYDHERFLFRAYASFLCRGFERGDPCLLVGRPAAREAIVARVATLTGDSREFASRLIFVDADAALSESMDGLVPDPARFKRAFDGLSATVRERGGDRTVWMCGEMADLLCKVGNHAAAIQIEQLWNAACAGPRYAVMCGYCLQTFDADIYGHQFRSVCRRHTHVLPAEGFADAPDDRARFEQVARLQQRVRALDGALAHDPAPAAGTRTIYIVDDDVSVRRSLARLLSAVDLRVQTFPSAEAFLAEVDPAGGACLILDLQLLGMSGHELQSLIARNRWDITVIAMSGSPHPEIEAEALRLGALAFLRKPFDAQALLDAVHRTCAPARVKSRR
jgi:CheY-like chemotaxis protein